MLQRMREWIPEIDEETAHDPIFTQESRKLPKIQGVPNPQLELEVIEEEAIEMGPQ